MPASEVAFPVTRSTVEQYGLGKWTITRNWKTAKGFRPQPDEFTFVHDDYDGPEDGRCGAALSLTDALDQIEDFEDEAAERAERHRQHQREAAARNAAHIAELKATVPQRLSAMREAFARSASGEAA